MALKPTNSFLHRPMTYLPLSFIALLLLVSNTPPLISAAKSGEYAKPVPRHSHPMKEKLTQFKIYWHDIQSGPNPTSVNIIKPPAANTSSAASGFGWTNMIDNPLTEAPDMKSKLVGRAQGFYSMVSQSEIGLIMAMNFAFMEGKYNGSSITILGRNLVMDKSREMPIVGGTGLFRFARGYVELRTHSVDLKTGNACVEYNCYVMHY